MGLGWVELQDKIWGMVSSEVGTRFSVGLIYKHVLLFHSIISPLVSSFNDLQPVTGISKLFLTFRKESQLFCIYSMFSSK